MSVMIEVEGLRKQYGTFAALSGVSFRVAAGEIIGFLGPNGAGKSTTMKILTGYISPSAGQVRVAGYDVVAEPLEVRRRIGYLPEAAPIYEEMRVRDYLDFIGQVRGMAAAERARAIDRVVGECDIGDRLKQVIGTLSKGYRQRVGLAQALLHQPPILILDEPTSGLDPNQLLSIRDLIRRIGASRTVILSTHIMQEVQATCDRVIILNRGQVVADALTESMQRGVTLSPASGAELQEAAEGMLAQVQYGAGTVRLEAKVIHAALEAIAGVQQVRLLQGQEAEIDCFEVLAMRDVRADLFQLAVDRGLRMYGLHREKSSLEEVFRRLTV